MPLKSRAQIRKWFELERDKQITRRQLNRALMETPKYASLPERVKKTDVKVKIQLGHSKPVIKTLKRKA